MANPLPPDNSQPNQPDPSHSPEDSPDIFSFSLATRWSYVREATSLFQTCPCKTLEDIIEESAKNPSKAGWYRGTWQLSSCFPNALSGEGLERVLGWCSPLVEELAAPESTSGPRYPIVVQTLLGMRSLTKTVGREQLGGRRLEWAIVLDARSESGMGLGEVEACFRLLSAEEVGEQFAKDGRICVAFAKGDERWRALRGGEGVRMLVQRGMRFGQLLAVHIPAFVKPPGQRLLEECGHPRVNFMRIPMEAGQEPETQPCWCIEPSADAREATTGLSVQRQGEAEA